MRNVILSILVMAILSPGMAFSQDMKKELAEDLLMTMNMPNILKQSINKELDAQIRQNNKLKKYRTVMQEFLYKHMSWEGLGDALIDMYAAEFTEAELRDLIAFYRTPTGRKSVEKMQLLTNRTAEIGAFRIQQNMGELEQLLREAAKNKDDASQK